MQISLRIEEKLLKKIDKKAEQEKRTRSNLICKILEEEMEKK